MAANIGPLTKSPLPQYSSRSCFLSLSDIIILVSRSGWHWCTVYSKCIQCMLLAGLGRLSADSHRLSAGQAHAQRPQRPAIVAVAWPWLAAADCPLSVPGYSLQCTCQAPEAPEDPIGLNHAARCAATHSRSTPEGVNLVWHLCASCRGPAGPGFRLLQTGTGYRDSNLRRQALQARRWP